MPGVYILVKLDAADASRLTKCIKSFKSQTPFIGDAMMNNRKRSPDSREKKISLYSHFVKIGNCAFVNSMINKRRE